MMLFSWIPDYFIPVVLVIMLVVQILRQRGFTRVGKMFLFFPLLAVIYVVCFYGALTYLQYRAWATSEFTLVFLPPHTSYFYLLQFHFIRFALYHAIAGLVAMLFWCFGRYANSRTGGRYFEPEELPIAAAVIILLGSPTLHYGWLTYFFLLSSSYAATQLYYFLRWKKMKLRDLETEAPRVPLYFFWAPAGLLVILIEYLLR